MPIDPTTLSPSTASSLGSTPTATAADTQDRFLKLLVAQMQNQDPMNPMDNAQVTSQMAQIQTVSGLDTLNTTVKSLTGQFTQMQTMQGIALIGHDVVVPGNRLNVVNGVGTGSYSLATAAGSVKLEVLNAGGAVMDTVDLGPRQAGSNSFSIPADQLTDPHLSFRITASSGTNAVASTTFAQDKVVAVSNSNGSLQLELQNLGIVDYAQITAFN